MSQLRSILDDLRAKRLWPVAVALVAAIAAVPLLLSSNAAPPTVARTPVGGGTAPRASALPAVSVVAASAHARITGRARDPFSLQSPPHVAAATGVSSGPAPATGPVPSAGGARTSDPGGSGTSTGNSATSTTTTTTQPGRVRYFFYTTDVSFGKDSGTRARIQKRSATDTAAFGR